MTRAQPGAARTGTALETMGYRPIVVPLLATRAIGQQPPDLTDVAALVFTSRNGVTAFIALLNSRDDSRDRPVFTVGHVTAQAAREAGFADVRSAGRDVAALAALIQADWRAIVGDRSGVLLWAGAREPTADLGALIGPSVTTRVLPVYEAHETHVAPPDAFDAVLVHSPRAARALADTLLVDAARGRLAIALSPAVAEPLTFLPFREVAVAASPDEAALHACLVAALSACVP